MDATPPVQAPGPIPGAPVSSGPPIGLIVGGVVVVIIIIALVIMFSGGSAAPGAPSVPKGPPVNCVVSDWTNQGSCSKFCGPGEQTQTRTVTTPASNGGTACPALTQKVPCNLRPCNNVDCAVSAWSAYNPSICTSTSVFKTRTRTVRTAQVDYGAACPPLSENQKCTPTEVDTVCRFTLSTTPNLSGCLISATGAVSGTKSNPYTSTVSGCSKPALSSTCTSADTAKCNYTKTEDKSKCKISSNDSVSGKKKITWTSTVTGCPPISVRGDAECTSADVAASPATSVSGGGGGGSRTTTPPAPSSQGGMGGGNQTTTAPSPRGGGGQTTPAPQVGGVISTTLTATPTYTCPSGYTYDATKAVGQKCRKGGNRTEAETAICPATYTYNSTSQMCTKTVMTPAPAPGPSSVFGFSPVPSSLGMTGSTPSPSPVTMMGSSPSPSPISMMGSSPSPSPFDTTGLLTLIEPVDMMGSSPSPSPFDMMGYSPSPSSGPLDILATSGSAPSPSLFG